MVKLLANWHVKLDDGSEADRHIEIAGAAKLEVGELLMGTLYGRQWRITSVDPDDLRAVAKAVPKV
jgi:hypothetical protein